MLSAVRLTGDAIAIAVHMFAVARIAVMKRSLASGAEFVAATIMDGLLNRIPRRHFFLCDRGEVIDAEEGQDDQGSSGFEERVAGHLRRMA